MEIDNLSSFSPKDIANEIFENDPKNPCSYQLLAVDSNGDLTYILEVLLTILMEGFDILNGDITTIPLDLFCKNSIMAMNPWIRSIGFNIIVSEIDVSNKDKYMDYYCRIVLNRGDYVPLFMITRNNKSYHFFLNGDALDKNKSVTKLCDLFGIFECNDKIFKIGFDFVDRLDE